MQNGCRNFLCGFSRLADESGNVRLTARGASGEGSKVSTAHRGIPKFRLFMSLDRPHGAADDVLAGIPGFYPGLFSDVPMGLRPGASKAKSRFFAHHPQTELRLGPRSLRMTPSNF